MRRSLTIVFCLLVVLAAGGLVAKTYNTPDINGRVQVNENDWDADELAHRDPNNDNRWGSSDGDLVDLYVTWDADNLYVGIRTVNGPGGYGNGYLLFIDTDGQSGITGATDFSGADFYARAITFSTMGADVIMGGWNLPTTFDVKHCSDPTATTDVEGVYTSCNPGFKHVEATFPWNSLYGLGEGVVPQGTVLRFIGTVVGGDGSGAYDALPNSSTGVESNPSTPWNATTDLDEFVEIPVDQNGDGVPDEGYPPLGTISGFVTLDDPSDSTTVATVTAYEVGVAVASKNTDPGGGEYTMTVPPGTYDITAAAPSYLGGTYMDISIADGDEFDWLDFDLIKVTGRIDGEVALSGGPAQDVTVTIYDVTTGETGGDGPAVIAGGTGPFSIATVIDGTWIVEAAAKGYEAAVKDSVVISGGDTTDVGLLELPAVVATKYAFTDADTVDISGVSTTVSLPGDTIYYYAAAWVEPRDDDDRVAYWDASAQDSVMLSATKLDPAFAAEGNVIFAAADTSELVDAMLTAAMFDGARAPFLVSGDSLEVLRVVAGRDGIEGVLEVGIHQSAPTKLALTTDLSEIGVGTGAARITGQLRDAAGNDAKVGEVPVSMIAGGVGGQFSVSSPMTDPNGRFELDFSGLVAGEATVTASLDPASAYANIDVDTLTITLEPGEAAGVELSISPPALRAGESGTVTAEVVDEWGNTVAQQGVSVELEADPPALVAALDTPIVTGADGTATGSLTAGASYGIFELSGEAAGLDIEPVYVPIDATILAVSEQAPESDADHNADEGVDLTIMNASVVDDALAVKLDFASNWDGIHLALLIDSAHDAAGGTTDPFGFPINYGHALLPEYCFTYKYAANDYGDLRKFQAGEWYHYDFINEEWRIGWAEGVNTVEQGLSYKDQAAAHFEVPLSVIEADVGDTLRLQAYLMQETDGEKRTAYDSVPDDATHDMAPDTGEWWETATNPVTLSEYTLYVVVEGNPPPVLSDGEATPSEGRPGDLITYTAEVTDGGGGIGDVFIDLEELGGSGFTRMYDDGIIPDETADNGVYTAADTLRASASDGAHTVYVTARDVENVAVAQLGIDVTVDNPAVALREFSDPVDDDHGPNGGTDNPGEQVDGLYYEYPTNYVFRPGSFDITNVEIFADGDWLVFRVSIQDLVSHQEAGAADWGAPQPSEQTCDNENRTDLNLQQIGIYIDAKEGEGATSGFPSRYVDIAAVDAWDYGISVEGWGKWFAISNGANSIASWGLYKNDDEIRLCNDHEENYVDIRVDRELFGQDLDEDNASLQEWDIIVTLGSHDGDSNDQNLGGVRWVNANTSEWQIGGGRDGEGNRERDPNIMDVAVSAGASHEAGRTQEEMLDYTTAEAERRFANNQVACVLEASFALDISPPIISPFEGDPDVEHVPWVALDGAPAVLWTTITDVTGVEEAIFHWFPVGQPGSGGSVRMVNLADDLWAADLTRQEIATSANVVTLNKTGDARVIVGAINAVDASPNENSIWSAQQDIAVPEPWAESQVYARIDTLLPLEEDRLFIFQDGTIVAIEAGYDYDAGPLDLVLEPKARSEIDISGIRGDMTFADVARDIRLENGSREIVDIDWPLWLLLHYSQEDVAGLDEDQLGIFSWFPETERWILKGGMPDPSGNIVVTAGLDEFGRFGLFHWDDLDTGDSDGLSGVLAEPNPFSPNGDGYYDETTVTFYLGREADYVNIEFYDLAGRLARRLYFQAATNFIGRMPVQIEWDGTDEDGNVVPYGIYVMRIEARFKTEPTFERINRPVVVIK